MTRIALVNLNRMQPPIAPLGLDYVASAAGGAGIHVDLIDLCLESEPESALRAFLSGGRYDLIGLSLRNVDDSFWPSGASFLPEAEVWVRRVRDGTDSPLCLGGVGFSIFAASIVQRTGVDFGIRGDGELALLGLVRALEKGRQLETVPGLIWREKERWIENRPAWSDTWPQATVRDFVDNRTYFRRGGQIGIETKRGCDRPCIYCADRLAKGARNRRRSPTAVADEFESLLAQGIDVFHLCDSEFNVPGEHARDVCEELVRRRLGERMRWYGYLAVLPFDAELAGLMRRAGCVGINFTGDAAAAGMLVRYRQPHRSSDLAEAVRLCRQEGIAVMVDLLLGGPGETVETVRETIGCLQRIGPDCVGAGLGVRLYPHTPVLDQLGGEQALGSAAGVRRHYSGPIDLLQPTFYIAPELGPRPATMIGELIGDDSRFFPPSEELSPGSGSQDHNYNAHQPLVEAIAQGARGAYWDILRKIRGQG